MPCRSATNVFVDPGRVCRLPYAIARQLDQEGVHFQRLQAAGNQASHGHVASGLVDHHYRRCTEHVVISVTRGIPLHGHQIIDSVAGVDR